MERATYTAEDVERGLRALVWYGTFKGASDALAEDGVSVPWTTLRYWATISHRDRYLELREQEIPRIHARLAAELEDTAREALAGTRAAVESSHQDLRAAEDQRDLDDDARARHLKMASEAATIARNLGTVGGIATQHVRPMRDMPSHVVEHRTADQALKRLRSIAATIDGTAVDITPAAHEPAHEPSRRPVLEPSTSYPRDAGGPQDPASEGGGGGRRASEA